MIVVPTLVVGIVVGIVAVVGSVVGVVGVVWWAVVVGCWCVVVSCVLAVVGGGACVVLVWLPVPVPATDPVGPLPPGAGEPDCVTAQASAPPPAASSTIAAAATATLRRAFVGGRSTGAAMTRVASVS